MKILFVTRKYPPLVGGMEALSFNLTQGFPEPKTIVALRRSQKHLVWFLPYACLRTAITAFRYDLIHLGDPLLGAVGFLPRLLFGRKVAMTVHGLDLTFESRLYQWYLRRFLRADAYVPISESTRRIAESRGLSPLHTLSIGAPRELFELARDPHADPALNELRQGRVVLVTVGRLVRRKGVAWFVRNVLPHVHDVLYVVVGEGGERAEIERAARECDVQSKLYLAGAVSEARLRALLSAADIFVMPNIPTPGDVEGFGIVAIEAAAAGLPVVAARLEGIPDAIHDQENGVLVNPEDAAEFIRVIGKLTADPEARRRLGERARAFTRRINSWEAIVASYAELFRSLID